jgi:hypothetical protein
MSYTLIEHKKLTSDASSISFDNIPQFYSDLIVLASARSTTTGFGVHHNLLLRPNGLTTNQTDRVLYGTGSSVASNTDTEIRANITSSGATANTFGNATFYIPNYSGSTNKSISADSVTENNATEAHQYLTAGLWSSTAPITSLTLLSGAGNLATGSSISLYGINRQQAIGAPKALGGQISFANGHWYHAFTGSGSFTPIENLEVDALVIAGGGGGGAQAGGGGGAGGVVYAAKRLISGSQPIVVGSGGTGASAPSVKGSNGTNSVFGSLTANAGGGAGSNGSNTGLAGGSGGGGSGTGGPVGAGGSATQTSGADFIGYGNAGGSSTNSGPAYGSGGGGGASTAGSNGTSSAGGNGGAGLQNWSSWAQATLTGVSGFYAGGGGGSNGQFTGYTLGIGGAGGGGNASQNNAKGIDAIANTGSGGGGGGYTDGLGGNGGSGIVIIRYKA